MDKINMKPIIYLEKDLFSEDETQDTPTIISQYFKIQEIDLLGIISMKYRKADICANFGRHSLNIAKFVGKDFKYCDCQYWVPALRKYILSPRHTYFNDMDFFVENYSSFDFPLFLRPCNGFKSFSGQVFLNKDKLIEERNFMRQNKNIDTTLLCMTSPVKNITKEWRTIFINREYCSGSQYMVNEELSISNEIPNEVIVFAENIAREPYFDDKTEFCIDVCESEGKLFLLEINSFDCSSFYGADLDKIYRTWSTTNE